MTPPGESGFALSAPQSQPSHPATRNTAEPSAGRRRPPDTPPVPDPDGYRAAHQHLERQVARLTDDNAALRGLLEQAILRLASATGRTEQTVRVELGAPPRPTWNRGGTP